MVIMLGLASVVSFVLGLIALIGADYILQQTAGFILIGIAVNALGLAGIIHAINHPAWQRPMVQAPPQAWPQQPPQYPPPVTGAAGQ